MKTEEELTKAIMDLTEMIKENHPELSKYLLEMQETIPAISNPKINSETLHNYYKSLLDLLKKYVPNHKIFENKL